jgi:hypothetical protein
MRDRLFLPKSRVKSLGELNAWLEDQCVAHAKATMHPELKDRTIGSVFQEERASLMELRGPFDGFVEKEVRATTTCLIMADHRGVSLSVCICAYMSRAKSRRPSLPYRSGNCAASFGRTTFGTIAARPMPRSVAKRATFAPPGVSDGDLLGASRIHGLCGHPRVSARFCHAVQTGRQLLKAFGCDRLGLGFGQNDSVLPENMGSCE